MTDERTSKLQHIAADRDWWLRDAGAHYPELATWLRERARNCRLPNPQRELLNLAWRYELRADHLAGPAAAAQHPAPATLHDPIYFDETPEISGDAVISIVAA